MKAKIVIMLLGLAVAGCATDVANRYYSNAQYPSRPAEEVVILTNEPNRPYEVIADFQSRGDTAQSLRKKAAQIGADAIIVTYLGGLYDMGEQWAGHDSESHTYSRIVGTAIKYKQ
jgi:hypothetical protein